MKTRALISLMLVCSSLNSACAEKQDAEQRALVEKLVRDQLDSWSLEDEELFLSTTHPEIVFAYPGARLDRQGALDLFRYWSENYSDTRIYFHKLIIDKDIIQVSFGIAKHYLDEGTVEVRRDCYTRPVILYFPGRSHHRSSHDGNIWISSVN